MQPKLLTIAEYFNHFNFQENGTGCGIEQEPESRENYFWAQTFLPKDYFNLEHPSLMFNPMLSHQIEYLPEQIQVKFELFGIGNIDDTEAFIFKPWVVNVDNPMLFQLLEGFHLFIPSTLFYNLIERLIFLEQINQNDFKYIRVLQDLPSNTFQRFGLDRSNVPKTINTGKLEIIRIDEVNKAEISKFYLEHWDGITPQLENKYFRPLLNTWYRITSEEENNQWLGLKKSKVIKTVGYLRLYNTNSSFTGGTSIEYIIDKAFRNKGYATQASSALINYLKRYSYAISLGAEVNAENKFSIKVLKRLGFNENNSSPYNRDNFGLSLFDQLKVIESNFENGDVELSVMNKYADRYSRYF